MSRYKFKTPTWLLPCPQCGDLPKLDDSMGGYSIVCDNCYDGASDTQAPSNFIGYAYDHKSGGLVKAGKMWNERVEKYLDEVIE